MRAYLDNAATTAIDPQVLEVMLPYLKEQFGNPSSIHGFGRPIRAAIERARKTVAQLIGCAPSELFFTSGGTEADNTALSSAVTAYGLKYIISSPLEHHAVTHTIEYLEKLGLIKALWVKHDELGKIDLDHLEYLLAHNPKALVSIMHANNELGNINPIETIAALCNQFGALFHTDAVQTLGKLPIHTESMGMHYLAGAAHKFHGPKGIGLLYIRSGYTIPPLIHGGAQERNMRGGTENVAGIVGLAKALELAYAHREVSWQHATMLKERLIQAVKQFIPDVQFNGLSFGFDDVVPHVVNFSLPAVEDSDMLLFNLDIAGVAASGGSACSSGSSVGSHVIAALHQVHQRPGFDNRPAIRFSFCRNTTVEEVDHAVKALADLYAKQAVTV